MIREIVTFSAVIGLGAFVTVHSQTPTDLAENSSKKSQMLEELSLEDLLNVEIEIASASQKKGLTSRESPGIVSLLTREEILNAGCRDMIDVLRLIPGFEFAQDVQGVVGPVVRGNWALEGKMLLMIDGIEMNELLYGSTQFGNEISIDHIKRVEVIRGPGSASYGGFAELAVVNIITQQAADGEEIRIGGSYGQMAETFARRTGTLSALFSFEKVKVSLHAFGGQGNRSDRTFTDIDGNSFAMAEQHRIDPINVNLGVQYKDFSARVLYNRYNQANRNYYGITLEETIDPYIFQTIGVDIRQKITLSEDFTITPRFRLTDFTPWQTRQIVPYTNDTINSSVVFDQSALRIRGSIMGEYDLSENISLTGGFEYFSDQARANNNGLAPDIARANTFDFNGLETLNYNNLTLFAQASFNTDIGNIVLGGRYDAHSEFDAVFVPRFAITKAFDKFHIKALASQAFRAPVVYNIQLPVINNLPPIKPEKATVIELEAGYQLSNTMIVSANLYHITINDPITYTSLDVNGRIIESYANFEKTGTQGIELEYRIRDSWGYATLNYSFAMVNSNTVSKYAVNGFDINNNIVNEENIMLATAPHKFAFNASFNLSRGLTINPSGQWIAPRWGVTGFTNNDENILTKFDAAFLANVFLRYENAFIYGLSLGIGVYDIFQANYSFLQPYNGGMAPLPQPTREILVRASYAIK